MRSFSRVLGAAALAVTLTATGVAFGGDTSTAEHLFQQGLDAMKHNQFKEACDAFAGSNEADPSPGTQINLALCREKQGKLATAWGWYRTAAGLAERSGQKDRAEIARAEATKIEPKLHKLVISVKFPANGMTVTRNGAPVPSAVLGTDVPIDPGDYVIEVSAKGKKAWKQNVHIASTSGVDRLEVPALEDGPPEPLAPAPAGPENGGPIIGRDGTTQRTAGFLVGGAGIAAAIAAIAVEFLAISVDDKSKKEASVALGLPVTDPEKAVNEKAASSHASAAKTDELIAIVTGAGAIVLLGVGITLVLTAPSGSRSADLRKPLVVPLVGKGTTGLGLVGTF